MRADTSNLGYVEDAARRMQATAADLQQRSAKVESGLRQSATGPISSNPDLAAVHASIRSVMTYIQENPVPAALLALGAGVIATSIWSERPGADAPRVRRRRRRR